MRSAALPILTLALFSCGGDSSPKRAAQPQPYYAQPQPYYAQPSPNNGYPQQQQQPYPQQQQQQQPPPVVNNGVDPFAALVAGMPMAAAQLQQFLASLPCPMPGLPPELARHVDCSLLRGFSGTVRAPEVQVQPGMLSATVDQRAMGLIGLMRDQGQVGSCSAQAVAAIMDTAAIKAGRRQLYGSAMHLFAIYKSPNNQIGLSAIERDSTADSVWRYDERKACAYEDNEDRPFCAKAYGIDGSWAYSRPYAGSEFQYADARPAFRVLHPIEVVADRSAPTDYDQLAARLAQGEPYYLSVHMPQNWMSSRLRGSVAPPPSGLGGPHGMVLRGYRMGSLGREFLVQNSWGQSWGEGGFLWIPERYLTAIQLAIYRIPAVVL